MQNEESSYLKFSSTSLPKTIGYLFLTNIFWEFLIMLFLENLNIKNAFALASLDVLLLTFFSSITFWVIYFRPKWKTEKKEKSHLDQQVKGLNQVAIISATDIKGNIIYANDNFCRVSGYNRQELLGKNHRLIKSNFHSSLYFKTLWQTILQGQIWQGKVKNKKKNGEEYWVYSSVIPMFGDDGETVEEFLSIRFDITNEKKLEEQLQDELAKNLHMGRLAALGEMASSVAHEINNPVAVILGKVHQLKRSIDQIESEELKNLIFKNMGSIDEQARRITKIVKGLKEFSHGGEIDSYENVNSKKIFQSVSDLCDEKIKSNGVALISKIENVEFESNAIQLEQVFVNLINNSIDAIADLESKWIEVSLFEKDSFIYASVIDSGLGISVDIMDKIMQPFFTTKPIGKGTGLGLSITKGIVEKLGGEFQYDSTFKNTCFTVTIPKNEKVIFKSLEFDNAKKIISNLKLKIEKSLSFTASENEEFTLYLKESHSSILDWLNRYAFRLKKNEDFLEVKEIFNEYYGLVTDFVVRIENRENGKDLDVLQRKKQKFEQLTMKFEIKLLELESKYGKQD